MRRQGLFSEPILSAVTDPLRRPTTVQALQAAVRRESADRLRATVLLLLLLGAASIGLAGGYLVGLKHISAAHVEAAGTWFGAFMGLGTLLVAARVFLGDRLYQQYQVETARQTELDRATAQAREAQQQADLVGTSIICDSGNNAGAGRTLVLNLRVVVENHSEQPASEFRYRHVDHAPSWTSWSDLVLPAGKTAQLGVLDQRRYGLG